MKRSDAQMIIGAVAKAIRERFTRRADHDDLVRRVADLERQLAELKAKQESP